ncbi:MAG: hypothetical protein AAGD38_23870 [Acidobacteriota bacterium]
MSPCLRSGDLVDVARARWTVPGDIVAFEADSGYLIVHRVIGYGWCDGRLFVQTRADRTGALDRPVALRALIGRVVRSTRGPIEVSLVDRMVAMLHGVRALVRRPRIRS